eukprot:SAG31_NODE_5938_length_2249_cov_2.764651_3_plen_187_part_01
MERVGAATRELDGLLQERRSAQVAFRSAQVAFRSAQVALRQAEAALRSHPDFALHRSPFAAIVSRGCLALVIDHVHPDDTLAFALACRAFREELQGRSIRTGVDAITASISRMKWIRQLADPPRWFMHWPAAAVCAKIAAHGRLSVLQWARANGCEWDSTTCRSAAAGGHLEVLQWARAHGCEWGWD